MTDSAEFTAIHGRTSSKQPEKMQTNLETRNP
jgi:hypothetical protein